MLQISDATTDCYDAKYIKKFGNRCVNLCIESNNCIHGGQKMLTNRFISLVLVLLVGVVLFRR